MFGAGDARVLDLEREWTRPPFPLLFPVDELTLTNEEPKAITGPDVV